MRHVLVGALLALVGTVARAESPRWGSFELAVGTYRPDIDSEFTASPGPYETVFGSDDGWMFRAGVSKSLFTHFGSLEVGLQSGFFQQSGKGRFEDGTRSDEDTRFRIIPASLMVTYRFDFLADRYRIPLAPYGRAALERYYWWVTDGNGDSVKDGATNGWSVTGGLALLLDIVDQQMARELDLDTGVNHTYLFFEVTKSFIDDFGSSKSWDLSDENLAYSGGLLFVF